jgi:hypothetical protein
LRRRDEEKYRHWTRPTYMNVVVLYRLLSFKFEAFISKAFPFQRLLACFWWNNVNLGAKGRRGWKELGPLLLLIISGC